GRSNLVYVDDVTVAYTAAHYVILYNTETKTQRLLPCHGGALADGKSLITISTTPAAGSSMCCWLGHWRLDKVAAGASRLLAWTKIAPPITGTTRKMSIRRLASQSITSVGTKSMPALSGTAGVAIVHDAACHPTDAAVVSVIGEGIFKLYRIGDGLMKPLPVQPANKNREGESSNFNFTCQAWLAEG
ncbi:hypothetical protein FOZ63_026506, partial [Perkinsus olseni]